MKVTVSNLGILRQAEYELGNFTIICGRNNTGKTYATYVLFGFLFKWREILSVTIPNEEIDVLFRDGTIRIDISPFIQNARGILKSGCQRYSQRLSEVFASRTSYFRNSSFKLDLDWEKILKSSERPFDSKFRSTSGDLLALTKSDDENELVVSLLVDRKKTELPSPSIIKGMISDAVIEIIFGRVLPDPFISSAERTGAAIFRKELDFARNRLLEELGRSKKKIDPLELLFKSYKDYALPVKVNVDFARELEVIAKKESFLCEKHPRILSDFTDIIGGDYITGSDDTVHFIPSRKKSLRLAMDESSSAVRSLLDLGFYLRHSAEPGDLLMVDEPELNLHPENQRRIARLFARLVKIGIKVFITTHSDYIVKELNTLIMLNHDKPNLKRLAREEGYEKSELLAPEDVRVYVAEEALVRLSTNKRRTRCHTFVEAKIDPMLGIEAHSFDETIKRMNEVQEAILWEDDV